MKDQEKNATPPSKQWMVVYTRPRWEKKIHQKLLEKGVESWCPTQKRLSQWKDRKKIVEEVLFKGYVFVRVAETERVRVLQTDGVLNFVFWLGKPAVVREGEVEQIMYFLNEKDAELTVQSREAFEKDTQIIVRQGLFMDQTGKVIKQAGNRRVFVALEYLGQVITVTFDRHQLAPAPHA
jgi:transcription antitermination factor NusG